MNALFCAWVEVAFGVATPFSHSLPHKTMLFNFGVRDNAPWEPRPTAQPRNCRKETMSSATCPPKFSAGSPSRTCSVSCPNWARSQQITSAMSCPMLFNATGTSGSPRMCRLSHGRHFTKGNRAEEPTSRIMSMCPPVVPSGGSPNLSQKAGSRSCAATRTVPPT